MAFVLFPRCLLPRPRPSFLLTIQAWGIGANDVANAFATSVGAGSLSLQWACAIAAVMEFAGALLMGSQVTDTGACGGRRGDAGAEECQATG